MKLSGAFLFCFAVGPLLGMAPLGAQTAPDTSGLPDYKGYFVKVFDVLSQTSLAKITDPKCEASTSISRADAALLVWKATGREDAYKIGRTIYDKYLARPNVEADFGIFGSYPVAEATLLLKGAGRLAPEQLTSIRNAFLSQQQKGYRFRWGNRELGTISGACLAAFRIFPDDPAFQPTRDQFLAWWAKQNAIGDLDENSGNYSSIGLCEVIRMVRDMGKEDDFRKSDRWRNTFSRYRAMVTPGGQFPEFNDDYFEEGGKAPYLFLFEYAASLYSDPTFSWTARKLFVRRSRDITSLKPRDPHVDLHILTAIFLGQDIIDFPLSRLPPAPPSLLSGVTHRYDEFGNAQDDKLVLRPSLDPGSPALMMELYPAGDHCHGEMRGSITYYEAGNVPVYPGGYGRYWARQTGDGGNAFYLQADSDGFPFETWKSGIWKTIRIQSSRLPVAGDPPDIAHRIFVGLTPNGTCPVDGAADKEINQGSANAILIDNIRLEGPAGVKILEDFESGRPPRNATFTSDASHGVQALSIVPTNARVTIPSPTAGGYEFSPSDYKILCYDIKQTGDPPVPNISFRTPDAPNGSHMYETWHTVTRSPFYAALVDAKTENRGVDCYAEVHYDGYGTWDSNLVRRIVLTKEGIIVVRDSFQPGPSAAGWTGGAVWQLPTLMEQGDHWFASDLKSDVSCVAGDQTHYRHGMLVAFFSPQPLTCGVTTVPIDVKKALNRSEAWGKLPALTPGKPALTMTVVVPTDPETDAKELAAAVAASEGKDGMAAKIGLKTGPIEVDISDTAWAVHR
jgi:hypothetical protein